MSNGPLEGEKGREPACMTRVFAAPHGRVWSFGRPATGDHRRGGHVRVRKKGLSPKRKPPEWLERETGFEPATSTLARLHSTTELLPLNERGFYARDPLSVKQLFPFCRKIKRAFPKALLLKELFRRPLVDDALGLAFGALDGMRLHKAHLGGDAQEFLDVLLDGAF